jgi:hypothetical protein
MPCITKFAWIPPIGRLACLTGHENTKSTMIRSRSDRAASRRMQAWTGHHLPSGSNHRLSTTVFLPRHSLLRAKSASSSIFRSGYVVRSHDKIGYRRPSMATRALRSLLREREPACLWIPQTVEDHDDARRYLGVFLGYLGANVVLARDALRGPTAV